MLSVHFHFLRIIVLPFQKVNKVVCDEVTGACMSCFALIVKISAARNARPLRNGIVFLSVCSFVRLSPVKFVKLFTRWQHLVRGLIVSSPIHLFLL